MRSIIFAAQYAAPYEGNFIKSLPNGIDLTRITLPIIHKLTNESPNRHSVRSFLAFGGRNVQKRIDLLYQAGELLYKEGLIDFVCYVTIGTDTCATVKAFGGEQPWFKLIPQKDDINQIFAQTDCFVSTSVCDTFSMSSLKLSVMDFPSFSRTFPVRHGTAPVGPPFGLSLKM